MGFTIATSRLEQKAEILAEKHCSLGETRSNKSFSKTVYAYGGTDLKVQGTAKQYSKENTDLEGKTQPGG